MNRSQLTLAVVRDSARVLSRRVAAIRSNAPSAFCRSFPKKFMEGFARVSGKPGAELLCPARGATLIVEINNTMKFINYVRYRDLDKIASARAAHFAYADRL